MKITLTRENHGTVLNILKNIMEKSFSFQHSWDIKMKESEVESKGYDAELYRTAIVSKHWNFNEETSPLIHVDFKDDLNHIVLYEGDIIKTLGGTKVIVQQRKTATIEILNKRNLTFLIKQFNIQEKQEELGKHEDIRQSEKSFYDALDNDDYYL